MKHRIKYDMCGPTTQCNSKTYYQMFQLSHYVPNLCPQPKWSLIIHSKVIHMSPQPINISHRILTDALV